MKQDLSEQLIYSSIQPGKWDLFLFKQGVSTNLTRGESLNYYPVLSPDSRYVVFTSERNGYSQLMVLDTNDLNTQARPLFKGVHFQDQAAFSPDGQTLYFVGTRDGRADLYSLPFTPDRVQLLQTAKNLTQHLAAELPSQVDASVSHLHPNVDPTGEYLVFSSNRNHYPGKKTSALPPKNYRATSIYTLRLADGDVQRLTHSNDYWDGSPVWSQDGTEIYFYSTRSGMPGLYRMDVNGGNVQRIGEQTLATIPAMQPQLAGERRISFTGQFHGRWTVALINLDGSDLQFVSDGRFNSFGAIFDAKGDQFIGFGDGPTTRPPFFNEPVGALVNGEAFSAKPIGVGPFFVNHHQDIQQKRPLNRFAIRGTFPNYDAQSNRVLSVCQTNKVVLSKLNGDDIDMHVVFHVDTVLRCQYGDDIPLEVKQTTNIIGLSWAPDKTWFVAGIGPSFAPANAQVDVWKIRMDGTVIKNLTKSLMGNSAFPNVNQGAGNTIVFRSGHEGRMQVYAMDSEGDHLRKLSQDSFLDTMPAVSPDGNTAVYSSLTRDKHFCLFRVSTSHREKPKQLTFGPMADMHAAFSPDGRSIAFASERGGLKDEIPLYPIFCPQPYGDIYTLNLESGQIAPETESKWENSLVTWR